MISDCIDSPLPSPHSDTSYLSSPDSLHSPMLASDHGVNFTRALSDHKDFYMDDGNVVFLVQNTYFKVHRFFFQRDSQFFRDTFDRFPAGPSTGADLLTFTDVTSLDFERFLGVLYPKDFNKPTAATVDEWTSILDLSVRWGFESIQLLAIEHLTLLASPIDKIVLGRKYHVVKWLQDAYRAVCEREHALTLEEGLRLGMAEVINISHARQAVRLDATLVPYPHLHSVIEETFELGAAPELPHLSEGAPGVDSNEIEFDGQKFNGGAVSEVEFGAVEKDKDPDVVDSGPDIDDEFELPELPPQKWYSGTPKDNLEEFAYEAIAEEIEPQLKEPISPPFASSFVPPAFLQGRPRSRNEREEMKPQPEEPISPPFASLFMPPALSQGPRSRNKRISRAR